MQNEPAKAPLAIHRALHVPMDVARTRIFISIASYRDKDVNNTIRDALANATHPDRLTFGVFNQINAEEDGDCIVMYHPQVKSITIKHSEARGVGYARSMIFEKLLGAEEMVLQIDAHSRFDPGWDQMLLNQYNALNDPKAVMSSFPIAFDPDTGHKSDRTLVSFRCTGLSFDGIPLLGNFTVGLDDGPSPAKRTAFIAAGNVFTQSYVVRTVKYDPYIYYHGEETNWAVRLWTHGFNLYVPPEPCIYHDYNTPKLDSKKRFEKDFPDTAKSMMASSSMRLRHLFNIQNAADPIPLAELPYYGFGQARTYGQWQVHFGVLIALGKVTKEATDGDFNQSGFH